MSTPGGGKPGGFPGWIFVVVFLSVCVLATWLTRWNYSRQVISSAQGTALACEWPETRIAVPLSAASLDVVKAGHGARVTAGSGTKMVRGEVSQVTPVPGGGGTAIVRLLDEPPRVAGEPEGWNPHWLPPGTPCSVTIDTTIPPGAATATASPNPAR